MFQDPRIKSVCWQLRWRTDGRMGKEWRWRKAEVSNAGIIISVIIIIIVIISL